LKISFGKVVMGVRETLGLGVVIGESGPILANSPARGARPIGTGFNNNPKNNNKKNRSWAKRLGRPPLAGRER
jgi:hypothetical protein